MYRADRLRPPGHGLENGPSARLVAIAFSFSLHGAILGGLYWSSDSPPVPPNVAITVELVADITKIRPLPKIKPGPPVAIRRPAKVLPESIVDPVTKKQARANRTGEEKQVTLGKPPKQSTALPATKNVARARPRPRIKPRPPDRPVKPMKLAKTTRVMLDASNKVAADSTPRMTALPPGELERAIDDVKQQHRSLTVEVNPALWLVRAVPGRGLDDTEKSIETAPALVGLAFVNPAPRYPYSARRRRQEGRVTLRVQVSATGRTTAVVVRNSSGHGLLDDAAVEVVRRWRFVPARKSGIAVAGVVDVPIVFRLTN